MLRVQLILLAAVFWGGVMGGAFRKRRSTCQDTFPWCGQAKCHMEFFQTKCKKTCNLCPEEPTENVCSVKCGGGVKYRVKVDPVSNKKFRVYSACNNDNCPSESCPNDHKRRKWDRERKCCRAETRDVCGTTYRDRVELLNVVGGKETKRGMFPWQVAIVNERHGANGVEGVFHCGGVIVADDWVLTAGHCLQPTDTMRVLAGDINISQADMTAAPKNVAQTYRHPDYDGIDGDVALLKLKSPLERSMDVWPICLPGNERLTEDINCQVTGFGSSNTSTLNQYTPQLQRATLEIFDHDVCVHGYRSDPSLSYVKKIREKLICAGRIDGSADSCFGDSGGALACQKSGSCQWFLAGTVSFGPANDCGVAKAPGIYANISYYLPWIEKTMKK